MLQPVSIRRKPRTRRSLPAPTVAFTVDEYCDVYRVSRTQLYKDWKAGRGPRFYWNGVQRRISREAAADYQRQQEAGSAR